MKLNLKNKPILSKILILCLCIFSIPLAAQQIKYTDGNDSWNPNLLGNHRAVVQFSGKGTCCQNYYRMAQKRRKPRA